MSDQLLAVVRQGAEECLGNDTSGHSMDHVDRVFEMSMRFSNYYPEIGKRAVGLIALLHDVDDYKLVGKEQAASLYNATRIMNEAGIPDEEQETVRCAIQSMGYSKALRGVRPETLEGAIVSDADMCDAIGASGIVRCLTYALSDKGSRRVFDPSVWPQIDITAEIYNGSGSTHNTDGFINHFFEKLLKLKTMMLTEPGKNEAGVRDELMIAFLRQYFTEQNQPAWSELLEEYLAQRE